MKFEKFVEKIIENMQKRVPEDYMVQVENIQKNNGLMLTGLTMGDQRWNVYPTIYLEDFYEKYEQGVSIEKIIDIIWKMYCQSAPTGNWDTSRFMEWGRVKDMIVRSLSIIQKTGDYWKLYRIENSVILQLYIMR